MSVRWWELKGIMFSNNFTYTRRSIPGSNWRKYWKCLSLSFECSKIAFEDFLKTAKEPLEDCRHILALLELLSKPRRELAQGACDPAGDNALIWSGTNIDSHHLPVIACHCVSACQSHWYISKLCLSSIFWQIKRYLFLTVAMFCFIIFINALLTLETSDCVRLAEDIPRIFMRQSVMKHFTDVSESESLCLLAPVRRGQSRIRGMSAMIVWHEPPG